eukprot:6204128-Pleurochrysis_carterae.AAC.3
MHSIHGKEAWVAVRSCKCTPVLESVREQPLLGTGRSRTHQGCRCEYQRNATHVDCVQVQLAFHVTLCYVASSLKRTRPRITGKEETRLSLLASAPCWAKAFLMTPLTDSFFSSLSAAKGIRAARRTASVCLEVSFGFLRSSHAHHLIAGHSHRSSIVYDCISFATSPHALNQ